MAENEKIIDDLSSLIVLEAAQLASILQDKWGISALAALEVAAGTVVKASSTAPLEQAEQVEVILAAVGNHRLHVIKEVRAITRLSMSEAKALVERAPVAIKVIYDKSEMASVIERLANAGGLVAVSYRNPNSGMKANVAYFLPELESSSSTDFVEATLSDDEWQEAKALALYYKSKDLMVPPEEHLSQIRSILSQDSSVDVHV